jgi:5'-nucleotidase
MNTSLTLLLSLALCLAACAAPSAQPSPPATGALTFTIAFVGDTHSHLDPVETLVKVEGKDTLLQAGGLPRLASVINGLRAKDEVLLLHAGDALFGTYYFMKYGVAADVDMLNSMSFAAMAVGNHDFDKGPEGLVEFARLAKFPLISANIEATGKPELKAALKPYTVLTVKGQKIGVIGLTTTQTPLLDPSGPGVKFLNPAETAQKCVYELSASGIDRVLLLSHLGYEQDMALVKLVKGIDLVVGGHSHSLQSPGGLKELGLEIAGPYPTVVKDSEGSDVPIVHAWEYSRALGVLSVKFDGQGRLISYQGSAIVPIGDAIKQPGPGGGYVSLKPGSAQYNALLAGLKLAGIEVYPEDKAIGKLRDSYYQPISFISDRVAAADTTLNERDLAFLVADALMWKAKSAGLKAQFSFVPVSYMRGGSIMQGEFTGAPLYEFMPFESPLTVCEVKGADLKRLIELMVNNPNPYIIVKTGTPYLAVSGLRFRVDNSQPRNVIDLQVQVDDGGYVPIDLDGVYRVVTTARIAKGMFKVSETTDFIDSQVFIEYALSLKNLRPVSEQRVQGW